MPCTEDEASITTESSYVMTPPEKLEFQLSIIECVELSRFHGRLKVALAAGSSSTFMYAFVVPGL